MIKAMKFISAFLLLLMAVCIVLFPSAVSDAADKSVEMFIHIIMPSIFPFMLLARLLASTAAGSVLSLPLKPVCKYILAIPTEAAPAVLAALTGGYLAGATALVQLRDSGKLSAECAERCLHFLILPAPPIVITALGVGLLGSAELGVLIYIACILASVELRWIIFPKRIFSRGNTGNTRAMLPFISALPISVSQAGAALPIMLASVLSANIFINILSEIGVLNFIGILISKASFDIISVSETVLSVSGVVEVCRVLSAKSMSFDVYGALILSFLIMFSGLSVLLQIMSLCYGYGMSVRGILLSRFLCGVLTVVNLIPVLGMYYAYGPTLQLSSAVALSGRGVFFESISMLCLTAMLICLAGRLCTKLSDRI